jgi:hypothetical protein
MVECSQCGNPGNHEVFPGHYVCDQCYSSIVANSIRDYSFKPRAEFFGEDSRKIYYGLEVEMMDGRAPHEMAGKVGYMLNEVYTKRDGSVPGGFEVVTHPCTLQYHESMEYDHIFSICEREGYKSHDASCSCGLHIHVSRSPLNERAIGAQLYLIHKFWDKYVKFSRRKGEDLNHWAGKYGCFNLMSETTSFDEIYSDCKRENYYSRYKCINLQNPGTIEYRIFRGTLKRDTMIASIQYIDVLTRLSLTMTEEQIRALSWSDLKEVFNQKKELKNYLEKRGL